MFTYISVWCWQTTSNQYRSDNLQCGEHAHHFIQSPPQIDCRLNQTIYFGIHTKQANSQTQRNQHTQSQNQNTKFLRFFQNRQLYIYVSADFSARGIKSRYSRYVAIARESLSYKLYIFLCEWCSPCGRYSPTDFECAKVVHDAIVVVDAAATIYIYTSK